MATRGERKDRKLLKKLSGTDVSDLINAGRRPKLQVRAEYSHMITIPSEAVSIIGLEDGQKPEVKFTQDGLVVFDFRPEVATDGGCEK